VSMARLMDIGLERLSNMLNDMAALSTEAVELAVKSFIEGVNLQEEVFQLSEKLRWLQDEVSDLAVELIARYQPVASDLRFLKSAMEVAYGFSRFGRYAYDISQIIATFGDLRECNKEVVAEVSTVVKEMIALSIRSFLEKDNRLAERLEEMQSLAEGSKKCGMALMLMLRYLERIADHATYIGEAVNYTVVGERRPRR
jgi:phosphate transport system protein